MELSKFNAFDAMTTEAEINGYFKSLFDAHEYTALFGAARHYIESKGVAVVAKAMRRRQSEVKEFLNTDNANLSFVIQMLDSMGVYVPVNARTFWRDTA